MNAEIRALIQDAQLVLVGIGEEFYDLKNANIDRKKYHSFRVMEISKQIAASEVASGFDDDMKELIMNSGTIKDGKAGVSINGKFKSVDELTAQDYEALQAESRTETEDIKVMAKSLQSIEEKIDGYEKAKEAKQAEMYQGIADEFGKANKWLSRMDTILTILSP